jgi:RNA polymerase sigma-70 factor (ECF subfamily)
LESEVPPREERQTIKKLRQGRRDAYEEVICRHYGPIYRFLAYLTLDAGLAEELTQETFAAAWANIDRFEQRSALATWLHRIAYRKFIDAKRRLQRDADLKDRLKQYARDTLDTDASNPFHRLAADEDSRLLYQAIFALESSQYLAIVLHYIEGLSFREMAIIVDKPVGTVKWKTSRALKRLREYLTGRIEK